MTIEEAREYWSMRLERAAGYSNEHWDAEERHAHADYIDALKHAVAALAICREREEAAKKPKTNGDCIRQMTDEELFDFLDAITDTCGCWSPQCDNCPMKYKDTSPQCDIQAWLSGR